MGKPNRAYSGESHDETAEDRFKENDRSSVTLEDETEKDAVEALNLGTIVGSATGEGDYDIVPGGWSGTDDATSTAPSDMANITLSPSGGETFPDIDRAGDDLGGFSDLKVTDVEEGDNRSDRPEKPRRSTP